MTMNDKKFVIIALVVGFSALAILVVVIGQGNVRHVALFWQEKVEQTVVFEDVNGEVQIRAIKGVESDPNPTLVSRTSFAYVLTVINEGDKHHRLYIEGFEVQTDLLEPGQQETITIFPQEEGVYNYYDKRERLKLLGQIKIVNVVPSDSFEGVMRDLI